MRICHKYNMGDSPRKRYGDVVCRVICVKPPPVTLHRGHKRMEALPFSGWALQISMRGQVGNTVQQLGPWGNQFALCSRPAFSQCPLPLPQNFLHEQVYIVR